MNAPFLINDDHDGKLIIAAWPKFMSAEVAALYTSQKNATAFRRKVKEKKFPPCRDDQERPQLWDIDDLNNHRPNQSTGLVARKL